MCRSTIEKEDVIVAQNAAGGNNAASVQQLQAHIGVTNILLAVILVVIGAAIAVGAYIAYKKCHRRWIMREIDRAAWRRSFRRRRDPEAIEMEERSRAAKAAYVQQ